MDQGEVEGCAVQLYRMAGAETDRPTSTFTLARRLLGEGSVERVDNWKIRGEGGLVRIGESYRIFVRRHLAPERALFVVGHELAHWVCQREGYWEDDLEVTCDAIGGALCAPWDAYRTAERALGACALPALAKAFKASQSLCALRGGETSGRPMALVAPSTVRVRGDEFAWPAADEIRQLATRSRPGLKRTKLTDEPRRVMVAAG